MGIWVITYKVKQESFPRIFEVSDIPVSKRECLKDGYDVAVERFKNTFQEDIDRNKITDINVMYCFQYGKCHADALKSKPVSSSEPLF